MEIYTKEIILRDLNQIKVAETSINSLEKEINNLKRIYTYMSEDYKNSYEKLSTLCCDEISKILKLKEAYYSALFQLDPIQREVITLHYFNNRTIYQIAMVLNYSSSGINKILCKAIKSLARIMTEGV